LTTSEPSPQTRRASDARSHAHAVRAVEHERVNRRAPCGRRQKVGNVESAELPAGATNLAGWARLFPQRRAHRLGECGPTPTCGAHRSRASRSPQFFQMASTSGPSALVCRHPRVGTFYEEWVLRREKAESSPARKHVNRLINPHNPESGARRICEARHCLSRYASITRRTQIGSRPGTPSNQANRSSQRR